MKTSLRFRPDGSFTLVQFTDTHFLNGEPEDLRTMALMNQTLDLEQPDLVVFTGDVLSPKAHEGTKPWQMATRPLIEREVPWAAVFGNHDDEGGVSRAELLRIQQSLPGCLTLPGPSMVSGLGNYLLRIHPHKGKGTAAVLFFLDSNNYAETDVGGHGWIRYDQIGWFIRAMHRLGTKSDTSAPPALVFFHIPLPEFNEAWNLGVCLGEKNENICSPRINTGLFAAMHQSGRVRGVFTGHDHINDFEGTLHGIRLCYGRASGYNTYGRKGFARGARVIRLYEDGREFTTWLRLDDGSRLQYTSDKQKQI
jgi:predicted phosphodiesterase